MAEENWWGANPPNSLKFKAYVDYTPYLTADPLSGLSIGGPALVSTTPAPDQPIMTLRNSSGSRAEVVLNSAGHSVQAVRLQVFDVAGRLVRTIEQAAAADGYVAEWNGKNEAGSVVPSGRYYLAASLKWFGHGESRQSLSFTLVR